MVWGPLIAGYLFLAGAAAGAYLTAALVERLDPEARAMRFAGRILGLVLLGIGLVMLMIDAEAGLKNPLRFIYLVMNPESVMTLGVYFICVFMAVDFVTCVLEFLKKPVPGALTIVGSVFAFAVAAYTGFLLGVVNDYPLWNNSVLPILFVASALTAGLAAVSLVGMFAERAAFEKMALLKQIHIGLAVLEGVALFALCAIVYSNSVEGAMAVSSMLTGSYAGLFWVGIVAVGLVAPLAIAVAELKSENASESGAGLALGVAGEVGALAGSFCLRLIVVLAAVPLILV